LVAKQHPNMTTRHRGLTDRERAVFEAPVFAHVGIVLPDGTPHVSAVWIDVDGDDLLINTAEGRTKAQVLQVGTPVSISATHPDNPYRNVSVFGRVVEVQDEEHGGAAGINRLSKKYTGQAVYGARTVGERRINYRVRPEEVSGWGHD